VVGIPTICAAPHSTRTEKQRQFLFGTVPALNGAWAAVGLRNDIKWGQDMTNPYAKAREAAVIFAGAFVTAMLFVSAATSLPIA
jgi:hypothetical protein